MKRILAVILASVLLLTFAACGAKQDTQESPAVDTTPGTSAEAPDEMPEVSGDEEMTAAKVGMKFGCVVKNLSNPYFVTMSEGAKAACEELGIEIDVQATTDDTQINEQMNILDAMISQEYDAILVAPLNAVSEIPWVLRANEAEIPVVNIDGVFDAEEMKAQGAYCASTVCTDNVAAGEEAAKAIVEKLGGKGKVAMIEGTSGATTAEDRKTGFYNIIDQYDEIEVVASIDGKYNRSEGYNAMTNILASCPDVQAVFAANDEEALGAIAAIEEAGRTGEILVVGVNYGAEIREKMASGAALGSINQDPYWIGYQAVIVANNYLKGETIEELYQSASVMMYE